MSSLFYIAILPNETIAEQITDFKLFAKSNFDTQRALTSPPHITIIPPFRLKKGVDITDLQHTINAFCNTQKPFNVRLRDFGRFDNRVIFVEVLPNATLEDMWRKLHLILAEAYQIKQHRTTFHPHITIAFKDLDEARFPEAWEHFSSIEFHANFEVRQLAILKHNGHFWEIMQRFAIQ